MNLRVATASAAPTMHDDGPIRLSVIVPFAPGETEGGDLLRQLGDLPAGCEVILARVNGPSASATIAVEDKLPVREVLSAPGRARQMNTAARVACGRWLWFLHADSRLYPRTLDALLTFITGGDALGYFELHYLDDGPRLARLNAWGANLRSRWLGLPFGDQGLVLPAMWFEQLGGYDASVDCGEDHLLVWRACAAGLPLGRIAAPLGSSARQYAEYGWWRTTVRHLGLTVRQAWPQWRALRRTRRLPTT